jgi:hypothetical protein
MEDLVTDFLCRLLTSMGKFLIADGDLLMM